MPLSCSLTPDQIAALTAKLAEAEAAYHSLMIGGGVREFHDQNGERVVYSEAGAASLLTYINGLRAQLGMCPYGAPVARPLGFVL